MHLRTLFIAFPLIIWSFRIFERPPSIRMRILTPSFFPLEINEELLRMMVVYRKAMYGDRTQKKLS